jgi:hypothetical protein
VLQSVLVGLIMGMVVAAVDAVAAGPRPPEGQLTVGLNFTIAPTHLESSETTSVVTSAIVLYAFHDGLLKPSPGNPMTPALAESWLVASRSPPSPVPMRRYASNSHNPRSRRIDS